MESEINQGLFSKTTRRAVLRSMGLAGTGTLAAACAAPAIPAAPSAAGAPQAQKAQWEQEWEQLVAAAKKEGKLSIYTMTGAGYRKGLDAFEAAFPGITIEQTSVPTTSLMVPKVQQEREAGVYSFDVAQTTTGDVLRVLKPQGVWDSVRSVIMRPDVADDKYWAGGFDSVFVDQEKKFSFAFEYDVRHAFAINTDLVKEGEIKSIQDLLNPKWKGAMIFMDPRTGHNYQPMTALRLSALRDKGDQLVKQLQVDQEPTFTRDTRQLIEGLVRGKYPIGMGIDTVVLKEFTDQGVAKNVKQLSFPEVDFVYGNGVHLFNRAPHPNAAKLFINWLLTRETQVMWSGYTGSNSRRTDVPPVNPEAVPAPGSKYYESGKEANFEEVFKSQKLIYDLTGIKN